MNESPKQIEQHTRTADDLWTRLHESMARLAEVGQWNADPEVLARKLAARADRLRHRMAAEQSDESPLEILAFTSGRQRYGIPVGNVIEVQRLTHFSPVPGMPPFIPGVVHWRGDILSLLDPGRLFGLCETGIADIHVILVVGAPGQRVAMVALEIEDIVKVPGSRISAVPELPGNIPMEWILGIHDDNRLILNTELILQDARLVDWRME